jgi:CrcB protein
LFVALGGAIGSVLRWGVIALSTRRPAPGAFPWGTLGVNLLGSLVIGCVLGASLARGTSGPGVRLFFVVGVLGGFTTFSAFSWETLALVGAGRGIAAAAYVGASVLGGLGAAALGNSLMSR